MIGSVLLEDKSNGALTPDQFGGFSCREWQQVPSAALDDFARGIGREGAQVGSGLRTDRAFVGIVRVTGQFASSSISAKASSWDRASWRLGSGQLVICFPAAVAVPVALMRMVSPASGTVASE